ncbi:MAG: hypothetical protein UH081_01145, partial [Clostridia bacterium]|nr:hypothetical protein [Clostridia bacterium]
MKRIISIMLSAAMLSTNCVWAEEISAAPTYEQITVPYSQTTMSASDLGKEQLYSNSAFSQQINEVTVKYGEKIYAMSDGEKYEITPVIDFVPEKDSRNYYFEFDNNFEANTKKGAKNKIIPSATNTGEYVFNSDGTVKISPKTIGGYQGTSITSSTSSITYALEKSFTLSHNKNWKVSAGFDNENKLAYIIPYEIAFYEFRPHYVSVTNGSSDTRLDSNISGKTDSRNTDYYRMIYENKPVSDTKRSVELSYSRSKTGDYGTYTFAETDDRKYKYTDTVVSSLFTYLPTNGLFAFNGMFDYLYIETDLDYDKAMSFVSTYSEILSKNLSQLKATDAVKVQSALDAYMKLPDKVKSYLVRDEYAVLKKLGRILANDGTIVSAFGNEINLSDCSGNGTKENPYIISVDAEYTKNAVSEADFVLADEWADINVSGEINGYINEIDAVVGLADSEVYYKFTVYTVNTATMTNASAKAFLDTYKELFKKTDADVSEKQFIENAINEFRNLNTDAASVFVKGELEHLESMFMQTLFVGIKSAQTAQELINATQNNIGVYELDIDMAQYIISNKPENGFAEFKDFDILYDKAYFISQVNSSGSEIGELVDEYEYILKDEENQIDIKTEYAQLSDEAKELLAEISADIDFDNNYSIALNFKRAMILAQVKTAQTVRALKNVVKGEESSGEVINNNFNLIGADKTVYNSLTTPDNVFIYMYRRLNEVLSFEDISAVFELACEEAYQNEPAQTPYEKKTVKVPYTKATLKAEDFGVTQLFSDASFNERIDSIEVTYG